MLLVQDLRDGAPQASQAAHAGGPFVEARTQLHEQRLHSVTRGCGEGVKICAKTVDERRAHGLHRLEELRPVL